MVWRAGSSSSGAAARRWPADVEYSFAHELLQEVAYGEIPRASRAERHRRAAEWIDALGRPEDHAELLAHHYTAALEYGQSQPEETVALVQRAIEALRRAGLHAMRLSANQRAVEHFSRAIDLLVPLGSMGHGLLLFAPRSDLRVPRRAMAKRVRSCCKRCMSTFQPTTTPTTAARPELCSARRALQ